MKYDKLIAIRVTDEQYAQLKKLADVRFTSVASVVRRSVDNEIKLSLRRRHRVLSPYLTPDLRPLTTK